MGGDVQMGAGAGAISMEICMVLGGENKKATRCFKPQRGWEGASKVSI